MAIDERYVDNVVLKKSALQNLLTNIKNYPIIDADFMESSDVDEVYGDNVWEHYTNKTPCIKITYGDPDTTKGNVIFYANNRNKISWAKKELVRLNNLQAKWNYYLNRWIKIRDNSTAEYRRKENELNLIMRNFNLANKTTEQIFTTLYALLRANFYGNSTNSLREIVDSDFNSVGDVFTWQSVLEGDPNNENIEDESGTHTTTINVKLLKSGIILNINNRLTNTLSNLNSNAEDYAAARELINNFKSFVTDYNNIIIFESVQTNNWFAFTPLVPSNDINDVPPYDPNTLYFYKTQNGNQQGYSYKVDFTEQQIENWTSTVINNGQCLIYTLAISDSVNTDFAQILTNFNKADLTATTAAQVENIVNLILSALNTQITTANENIAKINQDLVWFSTTQYSDSDVEEYDPNSETQPEPRTFQYDNSVSEKHSIADIETLIAYWNNQINNEALQQHPLLYGYKYVKVGDHIDFSSNWPGETAAPPVTPVNDVMPTQKYGTIRADVNGQTYELIVKGLEESGPDENDFEFLRLNTGDASTIVVGKDGTSDTHTNVILKPSANSDSSLGTQIDPWDKAYINNLTDTDGIIEIGNAGVNSGQTDENDNPIITPGTAQLIPAANTNSSLGTQSNPWDDAYIGDLHIDNLIVSGDMTAPLNITDTTDGINESDQNGDLTSAASNGVTGNSSASIYTAGGIYATKNIWAKRVFNAVFNDYAEYRTTINLEPGRVVIDNDDGSLSCATKRLQPGAQVISDTFGHAMGATPECKTPLAVAGRVLVYPYRPRENYHAGMAVCSAPNGTVDIMTREEIKEYPDCIVGIVSEIPQYETWGSDNVNVNGRIWIKIK